MAYKHGVYVNEIATSLVPPVNVEGCLPVFFGTAPVHLAKNPAKANEPVLCYSYAEAVDALGYSNDWDKYTLCEAIYSQFALYGVAPVVFVNVLDYQQHKEVVTGQSAAVADKKAIITDAVLLDTLEVKDNETVLQAGTDYEAAYDEKGQLLITLLSESSHSSVSTLIVGYTKLTPEAVQASDVIGGVDIETGKYKGLETLNSIFSKFGMVPGMIAAPGWSQESEVAAIMAAKVDNINGIFKGVAFVDVDTTVVKKYSEVSAWKNQNNYTSANEAVCWPMATLGGKKYHLSTHLIGVCGATDSDNDDIPYVSPSNKNLQADGLCLADGTEIELAKENADYLNGQGIVTALNFIGGWKLWGNETGCYPSNTDPKDRFLCVRRMFNWYYQTFIRTYFSKVDTPLIRRNIDTILDSENVRLNGLVAQGVLIAGNIEFRDTENPTTSLIDGIVKFHTKFTPPVPMRVIENIIEFDPAAYRSLFA